MFEKELARLIAVDLDGDIAMEIRRQNRFVRRLFDRLTGAFAADRFFMDVDSIAPGLDFVRVLEDQVDQCDLFLAVIGPRWADVRDEVGEPRLNDPNDFVRIEIESGLKLRKRIIPVLVNNAGMPRHEHLPESLRPLVCRNAVRLTHERFDSDVQGLVKALQNALEDAKRARQAATEPDRRAAEVEDRKRREEGEARTAKDKRQVVERARQQTLPGCFPEATQVVPGGDLVQKAEELANSECIKGRGNEGELRNHIACYPGGSTEPYAQAELEELARKMLGEKDSSARK